MKIKRNGFMAFLIKEFVMMIQIVSRLSMALAILKLLDIGTLGQAIVIDWQSLMILGVSCSLLAVIIGLAMEQRTNE